MTVRKEQKKKERKKELEKERKKKTKSKLQTTPVPHLPVNVEAVELMGPQELQ